MGRELPETNWITLSETANAGEEPFQLPGWAVRSHGERPPSSSNPLIQLVSSASDFAAFEPNIIKLARTREIPQTADDDVMEFAELAKKAQGDHLLAVLKADADSLGEFFQRSLRNAQDLSPLSQRSREMDSFFGITLASELTKHNWEWIYPVFAGGDDLLLIGPWNVIFDFAARASQMFGQEFGQHGLTLSAGIAFLKPKQPIKHAAEQAEELLHKAKTLPAPRVDKAKDQFAAFGQIWKWNDHAAITQAAKQLTAWVDSGIAERGWLQTLLRLAEWRQRKDDPDAKPVERMVAVMATARLSYFVARNFPRRDDRHREKQRLRQWADKLVDDFDAATNVETIYLSTIVRYALTATRTVNAED